MNGKLIIDTFFDFLIICQCFIINDFNRKEISIIQMPSLEYFTKRPLTKQIPKLILTHNSSHLHISHLWSVFH